ncbi:hypothetical protein D1007_21863 [Hordeum vulgare]|nr:hypothetical protein D1007_21863 [Hordeum vulgare]
MDDNLDLDAATGLVSLASSDKGKPRAPQTVAASKPKKALCMLGLNPSQHGLLNAAVAIAVSTGSSAFPRTVLSNSPDASACNLMPGFHVYPQASRLSGSARPR